MKTFASDQKPIDIEELAKIKCLNDAKPLNCSTKSKCSSKNNCCNKITCAQDAEKKVHIIRDSNEWYSPKTMDDLYNLLTQYKTNDYRLVGGNTGVGVYKFDGPFSVYIDFKNIPDLFMVTKTANELIIGAAITLTKLIEILNSYSSQAGFEYLKVVSFHISKIAVSSFFVCFLYLLKKPKCI